MVDQVLLAGLAAIGGFTTQHFIVATNGERLFAARTAVVEGFILHRGNRKRVGGFGFELKHLFHHLLPLGSVWTYSAIKLIRNQMGDFVWDHLLEEVIDVFGKQHGIKADFHSCI